MSGFVHDSSPCSIITLFNFFSIHRGGLPQSFCVRGESIGSSPRVPPLRLYLIEETVCVSYVPSFHSRLLASGGKVTTGAVGRRLLGVEEGKEADASERELVAVNHLPPTCAPGWRRGGFREQDCMRN